MYKGFENELPFRVRMDITNRDLDENPKIHKLIESTLILFYLEYNELSIKHKFGVIYNHNEYLKNKRQNLQTFIKSTRQFRRDGCLNFIFRGLNNGEFNSAFAMESELTWLEEEKLKTEVVFDIDGFKRLENNPFQNQPIPQIVPFVIATSSVYIPNFSGINNGDEYNIFFDFGVDSDFFYPYIHEYYAYSFEDEKYDFYNDEKIDNKIISFYNAPKYNSFLRDLKRLISDYNLILEVDKEYLSRRYYESIDGIEIDGKIIYQEDIDEGRICLEDIL